MRVRVAWRPRSRLYSASIRSRLRLDPRRPPRRLRRRQNGGALQLSPRAPGACSAHFLRSKRAPVRVRVAWRPQSRLYSAGTRSRLRLDPSRPPRRLRRRGARHTEAHRAPGACSAHSLRSVHAPCASEAHGALGAGCTPPVHDHGSGSTHAVPRAVRRRQHGGALHGAHRAPGACSAHFPNPNAALGRSDSALRRRDWIGTGEGLGSAARPCGWYACRSSLCCVCVHPFTTRSHPMK